MELMDFLPQPEKEPFDTEYLEKKIACAVILNSEIMCLISKIVTKEDFQSKIWGGIFDIVQKTSSKGESAPLSQITNHLESLGVSNASKTIINLIGDSDLIPYAMLESYAKDLAEASRKVKLLRIMQEAIATLNRGDSAFLNVKSDLETKIYNISASNTKEAKPYAEHQADMTAYAQRARVRLSDLSGLSTGFKEIDKMTGGLQNQDLIILGARPSMGKTALAGNIAYRTAMNTPVLFISLEMSAEQLTLRNTSEQTGINAFAIKSGKITDDQAQKIKDLENQRVDLWIEELTAPHISRIYSLCKFHKSKNNIGLIVIDYLQCITGDYPKFKTQDVAQVSATLKGIARDLNIPVLALSQLSRASESREDKRPQLSDLRDSGSIEQDADVIFLLHRDEYYLERKDKKPMQKGYDDWLIELEAARGKASLNLAKNRNGAVGDITLSFDPSLTKFDNL